MALVAVAVYPPLPTKPLPASNAPVSPAATGGTIPNDGLETTSMKSAAGRTRPTVTSPLASSACSATEAGSADARVRYAWAPSITSASDASGDGWAGSIRRSQLRTTSLARSGVPSEKDRPGRRWKTIRFPPSSTRHESARAGCSCRLPSNVVSVSNSCAVMAALSASPCAAGSSVVGASDEDVDRAIGRDGRGGRPDQDGGRDDQGREQRGGSGPAAHRREYTGGSPQALPGDPTAAR